MTTQTPQQKAIEIVNKKGRTHMTLYTERELELVYEKAEKQGYDIGYKKGFGTFLDDMNEAQQKARREGSEQKAKEIFDDMYLFFGDKVVKWDNGYATKLSVIIMAFKQKHLVKK